MVLAISQYSKTVFGKLTLSLIIIVMFGKCNSQEKPTDDYTALRGNMVKYQIEARGISDNNVLNAMRVIERHLFVPPEYARQAYEDHPLPIGEGQTISQPYIVAIMTEVLDLNKSSKVLEVGTGSGYQAAILSQICDSVYTIEIFESLGKQAHKLLKDIGYDNVKVKVGDGYEGWPEHSPFDAILATCAPTHIPQALKDQLKEGGKMVIPVGESYAQELVLLEKRNGKIEKKNIISVRFVPMINEEGKKY